MFVDLQSKAEKRRIECIMAYRKYVGNFEEWLLTILQPLQSGKLLTTDILVFDENLTVRKFCIIFTS